MKSAEAELRKVQDNLQRLQGQADAAAGASAALEGELAAEVHCTTSVQAGTAAGWSAHEWALDVQCPVPAFQTARMAELKAETLHIS